jgi:xylulokinase
MANYLAGVDVGTTGVRCMLFDFSGKRIAGDYQEYCADYPKPGWVEQDAAFLIEKTMEACRNTIRKSGVDPAEIASVAFSTQRSVTCPVDKDGKAVRPMISWQDARSSAEVEDMRNLIDADSYYELSGLPMGTTWIISKVLWMRKNEPELYEKTHKILQNQDLILKAFGAEDFHTDISDMAFYGVWDVRKVSWNRKLMDLFKVEPEMFGTPTRPGTRVGTVSAKVAKKSGFAPGTPVCTGAGDQNCGVTGMGAVKAGIGTVTLGTAGLAILTTGEAVPGFGGMMTTNHTVKDMWEVEGLSNAAASSLRWFRDEVATLELEQEQRSGKNAYALLDKLAAKASVGSKGLLYLPYLATAASPRWNANARSAFIGMSLAHTRAELTRSVMEGVVLEIRDIMQGWFEKDMKVDILRIGGGATKSKLWNHIQADIYGRPVQTLKESESTVLGAALLGGVGAGIFNSIEEAVEAMVKVEGEIDPNMENHKIYSEMYEAYVKAYCGLTEGGVFDALAQIQAE